MREIVQTHGNAYMEDQNRYKVGLLAWLLSDIQLEDRVWHACIRFARPLLYHD